MAAGQPILIVNGQIWLGAGKVQIANNVSQANPFILGVSVLGGPDVMGAAGGQTQITLGVSVLGGSDVLG